MQFHQVKVVRRSAAAPPGSSSWSHSQPGHLPDDREPTFTPALAQAAKDLADVRQTDVDLSPAAIATYLHVSVRTLKRAFARLDESFSAYIRRWRLEAAAAAFTAPGSRLNVSGATALWHFTDSSHFIRAFKKHGQATPTQFARRPV